MEKDLVFMTSYSKFTESLKSIDERNADYMNSLQKTLTFRRNIEG